MMSSYQIGQGNKTNYFHQEQQQLQGMGKNGGTPGGPPSFLGMPPLSPLPGVGGDAMGLYNQFPTIPKSLQMMKPLDTSSSTTSTTNPTSLVGMASSLFCNNIAAGVAAAGGLPSSSLLHQEGSQGMVRAQDIAAQVLEEIDCEIFGTERMLGGGAITNNINTNDHDNEEFDLSDLEPIPMDMTKIQVVESPMMMSRGNINGNGNDNTNHMLSSSMYDSISHVFFGDTVIGGTGVGSDIINEQTVINSNNSKKRNIDVVTPTKAKKQRLASSTTAPGTSTSNPISCVEDGYRFRPYQAEQWTEKFDELIEFRKERGHCCVPHTFKENPSLARWVKRQRYVLTLLLVVVAAGRSLLMSVILSHPILFLFRL